MENVADTSQVCLIVKELKVVLLKGFEAGLYPEGLMYVLGYAYIGDD